MYRLLIIVLIKLAIVACHHDHASEHHDHDHHGHDHDDVKLLMTAYDENFEVFAEADPFASGKTSEVVLHLTRVDDFQPVHEAQITFSMMLGDKAVSQTITSPGKPGIYHFQLQPSREGMARVSVDIDVDSGTHRLELGEFRVYNDNHAAIHGAEDLLPDHPAAIHFTKEQSWSVGFATAEVEKDKLGVVIKTMGELLPAHGDETILSAQTHGIVNLVHPSLYEGRKLNAGEVLLNISGEGLAEGNMPQRFQQARNNLERTRADYQRVKNLSDAQIASERELLQAKNDYKNAKALFDNLSKNFSESGQIVTSTVRGYLTELYVNHGQYVEAGQPVVAVAQNRQMVVKAEVQQRYAHLMDHVFTANLVGSDGESYTLEDLDGSVLSRARNINLQNHLLPVYLQIAHQPGWITGSLLDVYLKAADPQSQVLVPKSALVEEQGNYFVFVQIHPESFEKREVLTGCTDGIYTEILDGLDEGERIVTRGALLVKMAAASGDIDPHSGHVH